MIVRAPMTSVVMIFETTRDYAVIVPLMIANLVSFFLSSRLQKEPIYEALAVQDGIHLPGGVAQRRQGSAASGASDASGDELDRGGNADRECCWRSARQGIRDVFGGRRTQTDRRRKPETD